MPGYTGTVQLSSTDTATTSGGVALPLTYTFQASDHGDHVFSVTPAVAGTETLTASDTATTSISGSVALQVNAAPVVTHFLVITPPYVQAGSATSVAVEALDASNHIVPGYAGTVKLSSTDSATTSGSLALPLTYTFRASDHGVHVFSVTPAAAGTETLSASDNATTSISGSVVLQVNAAPVVTHLLVVVRQTSWPGVPVPRWSKPLDASNHLVPNYTGTIQLSNSDTTTTSGGVALPLTYMFQASDHRAHIFQVTFPNSGSPTLTATDKANNTPTNTITVTVASPIVFPGGPGGNLFLNFPWHF